MNAIPPPRASAQTDLAGRGVSSICADFPILDTSPGGRPLIYLDNAATSQKPRQVIEAITRVYSTQNANVHRGLYRLADDASRLYEKARATARAFLNAAHTREIIFTRGATESINLVAQTYGRVHTGPGDAILISALEHHANLLPWQALCRETGADLHIAPIHDDGQLDLEAFTRMLTPRTRLAAITHISNALGVINPIQRIVQLAHDAGVPVLVDGAQSAAHGPVDVQALDCDFFACSAHKMLGPTGIGLLYGKARLLDDMPPWQLGGGMIESVRWEQTVYAAPPARFEAGTPPVAEAAGFAAALDYLNAIGLEAIAAREQALGRLTAMVLDRVPGIQRIGPSTPETGIVSFVMDGVHPHDIAQVLDESGIAIRAGHHCAQPLMERLGLTGTARISPAFYNTEPEIEALAPALEQVRKLFR